MIRTEGPVDSEFGFELCVCQWAERHWPVDRREPPVVVARQLGTRRRRWDTVIVECDPAGLRERAAFGERELDSDLLHVVENAPVEWAWYREALPDPGYPWRYVRESVHRAVDRNLVETRKRNGRIHLRRTRPYPDWVERIVAVENKPDLDASAARNLADQVERDVAVGLADEVWVATAETGEQVEPALLEDLPVEAGILTVDPATGTAGVAWHPRQLEVTDSGTIIRERPGGDCDASAARFEYADPGWKRDKRLEIAERAYGRGWRSYAETMRPDCRQFELTDTAAGFLPWCRARACHQTARECSGSCPEFEPEPPAWRTNGWPIEGGPGAGVGRLLDRRWRRERPGLAGEE